MRTARQAKKDRQELAQQIARDLRAKARAKVRELKDAIKAARERRRELHHGAKLSCKAGRVAARERAKERRIRALAELKAAKTAERNAAKGACDIAKGAAKGALEGVHASRAAHRAEKVYQAELRRIERGNRAARKALKKTGSAARRAESDDEVRSNLDPEMVTLFERVKGAIRGSARRSRTEAFLHYAEEHPREILGALDDVADERIKELEREMGRAEKYARKSRYSPAELASVPF